MSLKHLAIIMDGNRRWAAARGLKPSEGHKQGYETLKKIALAAFDRGIEELTVFAFSTENWNRGEAEVSLLMRLFERALTKDLRFFQEHDIRLKIVGSRERFSPALRARIERAEAETAGNAAGQVNLCVNYGGRAEIVEAARRAMRDGLAPEELSEATLGARMQTAGSPDPDLIVRTSGEHRLSGFLAWSGTYSELLFVETHWPDFGEEDLDAAIEEYARRARRYGA